MQTKPDFLQTQNVARTPDFLQQQQGGKDGATSGVKQEGGSKHATGGTIDLSAALYGYSTLKVNDRPASARPAIAFTLDLHNAGTGVSSRFFFE